jgi:hypothetical protein
MSADDAMAARVFKQRGTFHRVRRGRDGQR